MSDWTKEPWKIQGKFVTCGTMRIGQIYGETIRERIVADHNGCKGIIDPATTVPELVEVLETVRVATVLFSDRHHAVVQLSTATIAEIEAVLAKTGSKP